MGERSYDNDYCPNCGSKNCSSGCYHERSDGNEKSEEGEQATICLKQINTDHSMAKQPKNGIGCLVLLIVAVIFLVGPWFLPIGLGWRISIDVIVVVLILYAIKEELDKPPSHDEDACEGGRTSSRGH